ncbi:kinase domain protein [Aeromicrobium marinum DSM 15272]|uniref:non-specific serine/threonine protein kinase n=1 Tax=Aeromicrobium marinum DSM 15272 TaxID=585531 RepID=E2SEC0_9ACTN|nr:serine/threonine-protein kinase [Aeromicrobium marinum]EFQ82847.1 kinase domain protein [Aeromicrobium marinum DSM 15272]
MINGRYEVGPEVGRGGMGTVWRGHDTLLDRVVALKRIGAAGSAAVPDLDRVRREARLAAQLHHPHVVSVFDLVDGDDGWSWLVMEYVAGETLAAEIDRAGSLTPTRTTTVGRQIASALAAAHAIGIVHRDVTPANVLIAADGSAKLTDFGIARAQAEAALTSTGVVIGSPAYLPPEVASGGRATPASDVWSLGATLFHAASGRAPYDASDNVVGALYKIVHEPPPRLPADHPLASVVAAAMHRDPEARPAMEDLAVELRGDGPAPLPTPEAGPPGVTQPMSTPAVNPPADGHTAVMPAPTAAVSHRRDLRTAGWVGAAVILVVATAAWAGGSDGIDAAVPGDRAAAAAPATPAPTPTEVAPTAAEVEQFVADHVALILADPAAAFDQLTPEAQAAYGGVEQFRQAWSGTVQIDPVPGSADAGSLTAAATVVSSGAPGPDPRAGKPGKKDDDDRDDDDDDDDSERVTTRGIVLQLVDTPEGLRVAGVTDA